MYEISSFWSKANLVLKILRPLWIFLMTDGNVPTSSWLQKPKSELKLLTSGSRRPLLELGGACGHEAPNIRKKLFQLPKMSRQAGSSRDFIIPYISDIFWGSGRTIYHCISSKYTTINLQILPLFWRKKVSSHFEFFCESFYYLRRVKRLNQDLGTQAWNRGEHSRRRNINRYVLQ